MTVTVKMLVDKVKLKVIYGTKELLEKPITTADISRPGLEMTGYFDYYSPERIQLVGMKEWSYLNTMTDYNRYSVFSTMFEKETPAIIEHVGLKFLRKCFELPRKMALLCSKAITEHQHFLVRCLGTSMHSWLNVPVFMVS